MYPNQDPRSDDDQPSSLIHGEATTPPDADHDAAGRDTNVRDNESTVEEPDSGRFEPMRPAWSDSPPRDRLDPARFDLPGRQALPPTVEWPAGPVSPPAPIVGGVTGSLDTSKPADRPRGRVLIPMVSGFLGAVVALAAVAGVGALDFSEDPVTTTTTTVVDQVAETATPPSTGSATLQLREANVDAVLVGEVVIPSTVSVQVGQEGPTGFSRRGSGSGVVFDTEGHIITNDHVASGSPAYRVVFADGRVYEASLVGTDPVTDLAVLKIDADNLVPIELGSSDDLSVGDPAVAVGNPLGLDGGPSLTVGVLSAFDRLVQTGGSDPLYGMLQTDAPITQGSSGGALVDETGRLIGITTAVGVSEIGVEGIGFATPVEIVERVVEELIANGRAGTAFLGITGGTSFDTAADGAQVPAGVEIGSVDPVGGAAAAGLLAGDLIVSFEGEEVEIMQDLIVLLRRSHVGNTVQLSVDRDGAVETVDVVLGEG